MEPDKVIVKSNPEEEDQEPEDLAQGKLHEKIGQKVWGFGVLSWMARWDLARLRVRAAKEQCRKQKQMMRRMMMSPDSTQFAPEMAMTS